MSTSWGTTSSVTRNCRRRRIGCRCVCACVRVGLGLGGSMRTPSPATNTHHHPTTPSRTTTQVFLHYCQRYKVGPSKELVFWKRDLDEQFFQCGGEALALPGPEMVEGFLGEEGLSSKSALRKDAWVFCVVVSAPRIRSSVHVSNSHIETLTPHRAEAAQVQRLPVLSNCSQGEWRPRAVPGALLQRAGDPVTQGTQANKGARSVFYF